MCGCCVHHRGGVSSYRKAAVYERSALVLLERQHQCTLYLCLILPPAAAAAVMPVPDPQALTSAPLFCWFEALFLLGYRPALRAQLRERVDAAVAVHKAKTGSSTGSW